jgi:hypothetical protein
MYNVSINSNFTEHHNFIMTEEEKEFDYILPLTDIEEYHQLCFGRHKLCVFDAKARIAFPTEDSFEASKNIIIEILIWGMFEDLLPVHYKCYQKWSHIMNGPVKDYPQDEEFLELLKKYTKCCANANKKFRELKKSHYGIIDEKHKKRARET